MVGFVDIIGQKEIALGLKNAVKNDKTAHAYIFVGPEGIGKRMMAEAYAGVLLCSDNTDGEACGKCSGCNMIRSGTNPDLHIIEAEGNSIGIEEIRNIQSDIVVKPLYSRKKIYIIIDADKMTVQAQNCLLKTLEEPPAYAVLILTTSNYTAILETVRSRTLKYSFKKNSREEIQQILYNKLGNSIKNQNFIVAYSDGIPGVALNLAESGEFEEIRDKSSEIVFKLAKSKLSYIFEINDFFETNKANINLILDIMLSIYRDMLVAKKSANQNVLINSDKKDIILGNAANFSGDKLVLCIDEIEAARKAIKQNANYQLAIEVLLIKLQEE